MWIPRLWKGGLGRGVVGMVRAVLCLGGSSGVEGGGAEGRGLRSRYPHLAYS